MNLNGNRRKKKKTSDKHDKEGFRERLKKYASLQKEILKNMNENKKKEKPTNSTRKYVRVPEKLRRRDSFHINDLGLTIEIPGKKKNKKNKQRKSRKRPRDLNELNIMVPNNRSSSSEDDELKIFNNPSPVGMFRRVSSLSPEERDFYNILDSEINKLTSPPPNIGGKRRKTRRRQKIRRRKTKRKKKKRTRRRKKKSRRRKKKSKKNS